MNRQENDNQGEGASGGHKDYRAADTSTSVPKSTSDPTVSHPLTSECDKDEDRKDLNVYKRMMAKISKIFMRPEDGNQIDLLNQISELRAQFQQDCDLIKKSRKLCEQEMQKIQQFGYKSTPQGFTEALHKLQVCSNEYKALDRKTDDMIQIVEEQITFWNYFYPYLQLWQNFDNN